MDNAKSRPSHVLAVALLGLVAAGCSGGSGGPARQPTANCGAGSATFCLTACNLGCTIDGGCSVNSIAQNQPLELVFSQQLDPNSVNAATISIKTAAGESPSGEFEISGNILRFVPQVSLVAGITTFGFRAQEEYFLTLPGGPEERLSLASSSGDRLARTISCSLNVDRGLVDLNNRAPFGTLISPAPGERNVAPNPTIVIEFDELIDVSSFQGSSTVSTPVRYLLRRTDPTTGEPDVSVTPVIVPGVPQAEATLGANPKSRITLQPLIELPSSSCIEILITDQVRDLSGTPAQPVAYRFYTEAGQTEQRRVTETFTGRERFDSTISSADWSGGSVRPGTVGGAGRFGEFNIELFPEVNGIRVWDTDQDYTVPAADTLLGDSDRTISAGRANFARFVVPSGEVLRIEGSQAPVITVSGDVVVNGIIVSAGQDGEAETLYPFGNPNGPGGIGGAGGAGGVAAGSGGVGAESVRPPTPPNTVPFAPQNYGDHGDDLMPPAASGYAGQAAGTGGTRGGVYPVGGDPNVASHADVNDRINPPSGLSDQQLAGAGGGGFFAPGGDGVIQQLYLPLQPPDNSGPIAGGAGLTFAAPPMGVSTFDHFLFGGSGGGGGGSSAEQVRPVFPPLQFGFWLNGTGGGGGGGAIGFRCGGTFTVGDLGLIDLSGGNSPDQLGANGNSRMSNVGGGGSGGCLVMQVGRSLVQNGMIDLRGGLGGLREATAQGGAIGVTKGGDGAPGYVRLESNGATTGALGNVLGLSPTANNIGSIAESDSESVARSLWYPLNSLLAPRLLYFELTVREGTQTIVYTDNPDAPRLPNEPGSPITFKLQGADVDLIDLQPRNEPGPWVDTVDQLRFSQPTGFRFMLFLDTAVEPDVEVQKFEFFYEV